MKKSTAEKLIVALALLTCVLVSVITFAGIWRNVYADTTPPPQQLSRIGPDISHCFHDDETRELWDCIRHKDEDHDTGRGGLTWRT